MQRGLFSAEILSPRVKYECLFRFLPVKPLKQLYTKIGREPFSKEAMLCAFIYMALRRIPTLSELAFELENNLHVAEQCGFDLLRALPNVERLSSFLIDTNNDVLSEVRNLLVERLIQRGQIQGHNLSIDCCAIVSPVKENNLKTIVKDRFDKYKYPKGDPESRLGVIVHFPNQNERVIHYFWGYKNHSIVDTDLELPVWEATKKANVHESTLFIPMFEALQQKFHFRIRTVMGDSSFDAEYILAYIKNHLQAKPRIPRNPRNTQPSPGLYTKDNKIICFGGLEMVDRGTSYMKKKNKRYRIFVCPLHHYKKKQIVKQHIVCPIFHPKFFSQKGCCHTIRVDNNIRDTIDYGSDRFKKDYTKRTASERVFSRLLTICMQDISLRRENAVKNKCTIAHITVLLVALAAFELGYKDKIRFVKTFVPNFLVS